MPGSNGADRLRAIRMLVYCTVLWALSFPVMKALLQTQQRLLPAGETWFFTALTVTYRFGFAGLILLPFAFRQMITLRLRELEQGVVIACFASFGALFQMMGLAHTSASISAFLTQGYCFFIPLVAALMSRRCPSFKTVLSVALVMAGVAALAEVHLRNFKLGRGESETLFASLLFAGQILALEHPRYSSNRPLCLTVVMLLAMSAVTAPMAWLTAPTAAAWWQACSSPAAGGLLGILILLCTLVAFFIMNTWQRKVTATEAGLIYCCAPVFATLMLLFLPAFFSRWAGIHYDNEHVTLRLIVGGGLITLANVLLLSRWLESRRASE